MSAVSHALSSATHSSHAQVSGHPLTSAFRASTAPPLVPDGPIHLRKDNFPLLHSLLDSAEYREAITKHPELSRRSTARHSSGAAEADAANLVRRKTAKSGTGVADLWSRVPRALGTASSVAGSLRSSAAVRQWQSRRSSAWELVDGEDAVETMQDALCASSVRRRGQLPRPLPATLQSGGAAMPTQATHNAPLPLLHPTTAQSSTSLPLARAVPASPTVQVPTRDATPLPVARQSLPDLPPTANISPTQTSFPSSYPARRSEHDPHGASPATLRDPPSTTFQAAVSQLKRMLTRTSRSMSRRPRASLSPSVRSESAFSVSTILGGSGRSRTVSGLSRTTPSLDSGYIDLGVEQFAALPLPATRQHGHDVRPISRLDQPSIDASRALTPPSAAAGISAIPHAHPPYSPSLLTSPSSASLTHVPSPPLPSPDPAPAAAPTDTRTLSPRPAGRLASSTPLSAARRTNDLEAWRENRRLFLKVLRDGPAGATPKPSSRSRAAEIARQELMRWKAGLLGLGSSGCASTSGPSGNERRARLSLREARTRPASLSTFSARSLRSGNSRTRLDAHPHAPPPVCPTMPSSVSVASATAPLLEHTRSVEELAIPVLPAKVGYCSYGSRWEELPSRRRRSLSVRGAGRDDGNGQTEDATEDEDEHRVWSKWRKWVRERRDAIRR